MLSSEVELKCGCVLPAIVDACKIRESGQNRMPVTRGRLHDKEVNVLRDTVVVRRDLVPDEALTAKTIVCVLIDGTVRRMPTAMTDIETQFYTGRIEAVCMKNPIYELIIENVPRVSNETEICEVVDDNTKRKDVVQTQAVMTRQQAQNPARKGKSLNVVKEIDCDITFEVKQLQKNDETLASWWQQSVELKDDTGQATGTVFVVKNELLWRKRQEERSTITQLAVPQELREKVLRLAHDCGHQSIKKTYDA